MPKPCGHETRVPECRLCELAATRESYARLWNEPWWPVVKPRITLPCVHEGNPAPPPEGADPSKTYYVCDAGKGVVCKCSCCPECNAYAADTAPPVPSGVVIGHYGMPRIIEVQVRLIREHCGPVPILIHDDHSPEPHGSDLERTCAALGVEIVRSGPENIGHAGGDLGAFFRGLEWAVEHKLRVLVKLSQRYLIDTPNWLADAAEMLLDGSESCLTDVCFEGPHQLPLRTEAMVMDVRRWSQDEPMRVLRPRRVFPQAGEHVVSQALGRIGGGFRVWPLLGGPSRASRAPGTLWHVSHTPDEYRVVAARFGVDLGPGFFTDGWPKGKQEDWG